MEIRKVLAVYKKGKLPEHFKTIEVIKGILDKKQIKHKFVLKDDLKPQHFKDVDLVLSVGGDGTFLEASHFIKNDMPLLGINSDVKTSEGHLTSADRFDFEKKIQSILDGKFKIEKRTRLEARLDSKKIPLVLNDVYIGEDVHYKASRYILKFNGMEEEQKNSGILISTGSGSTAWYKSAGGKPFSKTAKEARFIVREPYRGRLTKCTICTGKLKDEVMQIISKMYNGCIAVDSFKVFNFERGDTVRIKVSDKPLHTVVFC